MRGTDLIYTLASPPAAAARAAADWHLGFFLPLTWRANALHVAHQCTGARTIGLGCQIQIRMLRSIPLPYLFHVILQELSLEIGPGGLITPELGKFADNDTPGGCASRATAQPQQPASGAWVSEGPPFNGSPLPWSCMAWPLSALQERPLGIGFLVQDQEDLARLGVHLRQWGQGDFIRSFVHSFIHPFNYATIMQQHRWRQCTSTTGAACGCPAWLSPTCPPVARSSILHRTRTLSNCALPHGAPPDSERARN